MMKSWNKDRIMRRLLLDVKRLGDEVERLKNTLDRIDEKVTIKRRMYSNIPERRGLRKSFQKIMSDEREFEKKYRKLISGLSSQNVRQIQLMLNRMAMILDGNEERLDIYTAEERQKLNLMQEQFTNRICKISDDLYCYDKYFLPLNLFDSSVFWSRYGIPECETLSSIKEKSIIDVGAYVGDSSLILQDYTRDKVYAFEGAEETFRVLEKTIELNRTSRIIPIHKALTSKKGIVRLHIGERSSCNSICEREGYEYIGEEKVESITLDEFVESESLEVGLIKVDIEGGEQDFLKGAMRTIQNQRPILLISIYHSAEDFFDIKPLIEQLDLGYHFKLYKPVNPAIMMETILIAEVTKSGINKEDKR